MKTDLPTLTLTQRQLCDLEMLLHGGFAPLTGFLNQDDYNRVLSEMRLSSGALWPMPIMLDVSEKFLEDKTLGDEIALLDQEGVHLTTITLESFWPVDKAAEANAVFDTCDEAHPGVYTLMHQTQAYYIGGQITPVTSPVHYDFPQLRQTAAELKQSFQAKGWERIVGFQTRNPMHRAHQALTLHATREHQANLLIQPVVGMTKPGDIDYFTRVRCYQKLLKTYPEQSAQLHLLPLAMRMAGPREALWHALIRKNYGCTHFIIGRDHAGPGNDSQGKPFYAPYAAQDLAMTYQQESGIEIVPFQEMVYLASRQAYVPVTEVPEEETPLRISGTEFRRRLSAGEPIPEWFSYPEVLGELKARFPAKSQQGFVLFFTGLSGAGKSTLAKALMAKLLSRIDRPVSLLDGDVLRQHLSSELGFSKAHRDLNILRIGFVASEIAKHGGIALCAPIAPYRAARREVRRMIEAVGGFVEVHVSTPLEVCEQRDRKGLYAKARAGEIQQFTGISDPYETPEHAELSIDTAAVSLEIAVTQVIEKLEALGYLLPEKVTTV